MPNAKTGTVTMDVERAVQEVKAGKVTFRVDKNGNIPIIVGKVSFDDEKLVENIRTVYQNLVRLRPQTVKGVYVKNISLSTSMSPGIKIAPETLA